MTLQTRWLLHVVAAVGLFASTVARANPPEASNLLGQRGVLRASAATPFTGGYLSFGTDFQYYSASGLLPPGDKSTAFRDHSRMVNTYTINWAPWKFLEGAIALHVTSDSTTTPNVNGGEDLQVAVGDPEISLKGGYELGKGFGLGGLLDLRFPSAAGFFQSSASATNVFFALLASWNGGSSVPLGIHLNVGFFRDGSSNLFPIPSDLSSSQLFAAQVSSFNRVVTRLGLEYMTSYVGPFVELSLEPFVGDGAPGFGSSPGTVSVGARVWPTKKKGLQLLAALDVGVTGVGDGTWTVNQLPLVAGKRPAEQKYAYVIPRWNLLLQLSYRFDPLAQPEKVVVKEGDSVTPPPTVAPKTGLIGGSVLDSRTDKPIWNARVTVQGEEASSLAVNPSDGAFKSYKLTPGKHTVVAAAEGYDQSTVEVEVKPDETAEAKFRLNPRSNITPGTLRGTIKSVAGKQASGATVLIPEIDRTIQVDVDGSFSVSLKPGEYRVVVSAKGFRTQTKTIRILEGSTVILNVDLYK